MSVKQVIVLRKDLSMRKGKMCAQASHASIGALFKHAAFVSVPGFEGLDSADGYFILSDTMLEQWFKEGTTKICVGVDSEAELWEVYQQGRKITDYCYLVTDAGRTEFGGKPTKTAVAIGPAKSEEIDKITGHLKLL